MHITYSWYDEARVNPEFQTERLVSKGDFLIHWISVAAMSTNAGSVVRMYSTSWRTEWCIDEGSFEDVSYHASRPFSATYDEYLFLCYTL